MGKCIGANNCQCNSGYSGDNCQYYGASSSSIVTLVSNLNFTCFDLDKQNSSVCSGKGSCHNQDLCSCEDGYFGNECELTSCFGLPMNDSQSCNGRGICKDFNQCQCSSTNLDISKIDGSDCGKLYCKGVNNEVYLSTDPNTCSGNGKCTMNGCICGEGYYGPSCSQFTCFSHLNNDSSVCSSHGKCIAIDTCECFYNETYGYWIGEECNICDSRNQSYSQCIGYSCSDEQSCNNLGSCNGGICICSDNFSGAFCQDCKQEHYGPMCETFCNDNVTCNGNGFCNRDGGFCDCFTSLQDGYWKGANCSQCKDGYYGRECQISIDGMFTFNNLGNEIDIPIILPYTNPALQPFNCSNHFKDTTKLGSVTTCQWLSIQGYLRVFLASSASILPGDSVELDINSFDQLASRYFIEVKSSQIHNITAAPIPKIVYLENETFLSFTGFNGAPIEREGSNSYLWTISTCQLFDLSSTCKTSLQTAINSQQTSSNVIIEKKYLPKNMNSLTIQLELSNRFGLKLQPTNLLVNTTFMTISSNNGILINNNFTIYSLELLAPRNPVAYTMTTVPLFVEKQFSINGVKTAISSPYTIEYSMDPPSPQDTVPEDIIRFTKGSTNDLIIDCAGDFSVMDPSIKYQIMAVVKKGVEKVANASFDIYFRVPYDRFYLNAPSYSFSATSPLTISVNVPPSSIVQSVQWKCTSYYELNGACHSGLETIMTTATTNDQISITIPKSTYYTYNSPFFISVEVQTVGGKVFRTYKSYETYQGLSITNSNLNGQSTSAQNTMGTVWLVGSNDVLKLSISKANGVISYTSVTGTITMTVYNGFDSNSVINPSYISYDNNAKVITITGSQFSSNVRVLLSYFDNTDAITYKYNLYIFRNTNSLPSISVSTKVDTSKIFTYYDYIKVTIDLASVPYFRPYIFVTLDLPNKDDTVTCKDNGESKLICEFVIPPLMEKVKIMLKSKFLNAELEKLNSYSEYVISQQIGELTARSASPHKAVNALQRLIYNDNDQLSTAREQLNYYLNNLNLNLYQNTETV